MSKQNRATLAVGLLVVAGMALLLLLLDCIDPFSDQRFEPKRWAQAKAAKDRAPMARDLIRSHLRIGLSREQVVDLLGRPQQVWQKNGRVGYRVKGNSTYAYYIGSWSFSRRGYDDTFVYVHFDGAGKVREAEINGF